MTTVTTVTTVTTATIATVVTTEITVTTVTTVTTATIVSLNGVILGQIIQAQTVGQNDSSCGSIFHNLNKARLAV